MTCLRCNSRKSKCSDAVRPPRHLNVPTTCRRRRWPTAAEAQNNENRDTNCTSQDLQWHSKATLTQGKNGRRAPWIKGISQNEHSKVSISFQGAHLWGKKKFFRTFKTVCGDSQAYYKTTRKAFVSTHFIGRNGPVNCEIATVQWNKVSFGPPETEKIVNILCSFLVSYIP